MNRKASPAHYSSKAIVICLPIVILIFGVFYFFQDTLHPSAKEESLPVTTEHLQADLQAIWTVTPAPAKVLTPNTFIIELADKDQLPITGAELSVKLSMIGMFCGDMNFTLQEQQPGTYIGEGYPLMPGDWQAKLSIKLGQEKPVSLFREIKAVRTL